MVADNNDESRETNSLDPNKDDCPQPPIESVDSDAAPQPSVEPVASDEQYQAQPQSPYAGQAYSPVPSPDEYQAPASYYNQQVPPPPAQQTPPQGQWSGQQTPPQGQWSSQQTPPQGQAQQPYYAQQPYQTQAARTSKDHVAAGLLGIFLGTFGIHKFYLGYNTPGFIMLAVAILGGLVTCGVATSVVWLIGVIEGIVYLTKSQGEFEMLYVANNREWF